MLLTKHIVVHIVCRGYFEASGTEIDVNISVLDDRDLTVHEWNYHAFPSEMLVLRVIRIDTHCSVAHDGFGACCCNDCIPFFSNDLVTEIVEFGMLLLVHYLYVG